MKKVISKILNIALVLAILGYIGYKVYLMPKFGDGENVPVFQAELIDGSSFQLSDLKNTFVLLDFWGSWCGPCRVESPDLVKVYRTFHDKEFRDAENFEIVSVAIETKEERWKKAIVADGLTWPYHIVQLDRFKGPIAKEYGVREIPTKYLLDTKGSILMVNPSFKEIETFLSDQLK